MYYRASMHVISDSLRESEHLCLKRQCDRTLGEARIFATNDGGLEWRVRLVAWGRASLMAARGVLPAPENVVIAR
jgi:hypothetical protein